MSGQVLTIHGIAPAVIPKTFCFRNICDADVMAQYQMCIRDRVQRGCGPHWVRLKVHRIVYRAADIEDGGDRLTLC